jgi:S-adenosylmethionine:tRNA ribosyltransferase-isomerase
VAADAENYQTSYANKRGAVAAPTAGLHFTQALREELLQRGIESAFLTLHVGAGTFLPVKTENVREHRMHAEYVEISAATANTVNKAKAEGRRIVAVGTTSMRSLESFTNDKSRLQSAATETQIFITPGYQFKIVDALITNFHLPKSTLFMLVSAFSGLQTMRRAYEHAIAENYRFFSYGDACLLERAG